MASYALSEAGSGSDAFALATRAVEDGDGYRLTGRKLWITNAAEAGLFLVFANANPEAGYKGITAFWSSANPPVSSRQEGRQARNSRVVHLRADSGRLPRADAERARRSGQGLQDRHRDAERGPHRDRRADDGAGAGALDHALAYAKQRKQFGKAIAEFQGVQFELAEMATEVEAARLLVYNAARLRDAGQPFVTEAAMAKYFASQVAERVASRAVEILGGVGFTKDYPVEKLYRDAKIGRIYEGTSNMQRMTIAKQILGDR